MSQDESVRIRYEHEAKERKAGREEAEAERKVDDQLLHPDEAVKEVGPAGDDPDRLWIEAVDDKNVQDFLYDLSGDELRRVRIAAPGVRLEAGGAYLDLRDRRRGELIATGQEVVRSEYLVSKKDVDHEIWNRLISSAHFEPEVADRDSRNPPDEFPADDNAPPSATFR